MWIAFLSIRCCDPEVWIIRSDGVGDARSVSHHPSKMDGVDAPAYRPLVGG